MSVLELIAFVLLGVLVVLLPVGVIGVFASKLLPRQRTGIIVLYVGALALLCVLAADVIMRVPDRAGVDLVLIIGGLAVGLYAGTFVDPEWPARWLGKGRSR